MAANPALPPEPLSTTKQEREQIIAGAFGSLHLEELKPSPELQRQLEQYIDGEITLIALHEELRRRMSPTRPFRSEALTSNSLLYFPGCL